METTSVPHREVAPAPGRTSVTLPAPITAVPLRPPLRDRCDTTPLRGSGVEHADPVSTGSGPVEHRPEVEEYLRRLSSEQSRFLRGMAEARQLLNADNGRVNAVVAVQSRLTQQFLDAQRSIIRRRADADARVAAIGAEAEVEAERIMARAHERVGLVRSGGGRLAPPRSAADRVDGPLPRPRPAPLAPPRIGDLAFATTSANTTDRHAQPAIASAVDDGLVASRVDMHRRIAELGTSVVRNGDDVRSMARVIDEAFETVEPDGAAAVRQLRTLLDEWWRAENQEGGASVDDASARAAMRIHLARIEADELVSQAARDHRPAEPAPAITPQPAVSLPPPIVEALDTADHRGLEDVLSSLLDSLGEPTEDPTAAGQAVPPVTVWPAAADDHAGPAGGEPWDGRIRSATAEPVLNDMPTPAPVLPDSSTDHLTAHGPAPQEAFDRFWAARQNRPTNKREWVFRQVLFPAVSAIAVLALVLAWIG